MKRFSKSPVVAVAIVAVTLGIAQAWDAKPVADDPLLRMPGTQPEQGVSLEAPGRCLNCHSGYNAAVEPGHNWKGSMMVQAARDPVWLACLTVAAQDSIHVLGNPNATDLCLRCHSPGGWLGGRSDPTGTDVLRVSAVRLWSGWWSRNQRGLPGARRPRCCLGLQVPGLPHA